jgi:hypothetical protein
LIEKILPQYQTFHVIIREDFDEYFMDQSWHHIPEFAANFTLLKELITGFFS